MVGSINVDITATTSRLPGPGETVTDGVLTRMPGGKGSNQASAAARLGGDVRMIGAVGRDGEAELMRAALGRAGVNTSALAERDSATGIALICVDSHGENQISVCPGANSEIDTSSIDFDDDAVIMQLEIPMDRVLDAARRASGMVVLNASPVRDLPRELLDNTDLLVVNEHERDALDHIPPGCLVAVTYGADGAELLRDGTSLARAAGVPTTAVSSVGAGDAFCAALVVGLLRGYEPRVALEAACAVGAAAVADEATQPEFGDLDEYVG